MAPGLPAEEYVRAFERAVDKATQNFIPDLILLSAGFDSLAGDPLGGFTLELDDVVTLTRNLVGRADALCGGRLVITFRDCADLLMSGYLATKFLIRWPAL